MRNEHRGSVTAEAAVVLPVMAAFVLGLVWMVSVGLAQVQVVDRPETRRVPGPRRRRDQCRHGSGPRSTAPRGADFRVSSDGNRTTVVVSSSETAPGWLLVPLPSVTVSSKSTVEVESDVPLAQ